MKFASFETIVAAIYDYLPGTKSDYGKGAQTAVAFTGGYLAGILCAIVSHPADVMVSKLNAERAPGESFGGAMSRIYSKIGFGGLWNGLAVRIVMIGNNVLIHCFSMLMSTRYIDGLTMDDIRFFQDLHGLANHWWWWRSEKRLALGGIVGFGQLYIFKATSPGSHDRRMLAAVNILFILSSPGVML